MIDTIKKVKSENKVVETICRDSLWQAYTPQMFKLSLLYEALSEVIHNQYKITDDASALEKVGYHPQIVEGHRDNIKITHPDDIALAEYYLSKQVKV